MEKVVAHFIAEQDIGEDDLIVLLEPPATFRQPSDINAALSYLGAHPEASGVRSVTRVERPPYFLNTILAGFMQPLVPMAYYGQPPNIWRDNGVVNVIRVSSFNKHGVLMTPAVLGMEISEQARGLDIDGPDDLALAQVMADELDRV